MRTSPCVEVKFLQAVTGHALTELGVSRVHIIRRQVLRCQFPRRRMMDEWTIDGIGCELRSFVFLSFVSLRSGYSNSFRCSRYASATRLASSRIRRKSACRSVTPTAPRASRMLKRVRAFEDVIVRGDDQSLGETGFGFGVRSVRRSRACACDVADFEIILAVLELFLAADFAVGDACRSRARPRRL